MSTPVRAVGGACLAKPIGSTVAPPFPASQPEDELEFKPLPGLLGPLDPEVTVFANQTAAATKTYLVAPQGRGAVPQPLGFDEVVSTNGPYLHNGQIASEFGFGSGVVVKERVVLTAAHVLFDDLNLRYATEVKWFHQKHRGSYQPAPQIPRGWYVFEGYAQQRQIENSPGTQSLDAAKLDAAAMFFVGTPPAPSTPGRSGFAGFLVSDPAVQYQHLLSGNPIILVGYPVAGVPPDQIGQMHATPPACLSFSHLQHNLFSTPDAQAFPGMSGGAVFVKTTSGMFHPAGLIVVRHTNVVARVLDSPLVDLINRAEITSYSGGNGSGGGEILVSPYYSSSGVAGGVVEVRVKPRSVRGGRGGWRIEVARLSFTLAPEARIPLQRPGPFVIEFREVAGYD